MLPRYHPHSRQLSGTLDPYRSQTAAAYQKSFSFGAHKGTSNERFAGGLQPVTAIL